MLSSLRHLTHRKQSWSNVLLLPSLSSADIYLVAGRVHSARRHIILEAALSTCRTSSSTRAKKHPTSSNLVNTSRSAHLRQILTMRAATTPAVERPMFLSADKRKISYQSTSGNTITLEFKDSKAIDSLRSFTQQNKPEQPENMKVTVDGIAKSREEDHGLWMGIYDTLSFWCMEAMEVAAFGPYDEPPK